MKLTEAEKLILLMLADIYKSRKIKGSVDAEFVREAISSGNAWALSHKYKAQAYASEDHASEEVEAVYDALDMWRMLEKDYKQLNAQDKARVEQENHGPVKMDGFDGHEDQLGIARFIIEDMDLYEPLKGRANVDCHFPVKDMYARMVSAFKPIRAQLSSRAKHGLTADEIIEVLQARRAP